MSSRTEEGDSAAISGGERGNGSGKSGNVFVSELVEGEVSLKLSGVDLDLDESDGGVCHASSIRSVRKQNVQKRTMRKRSSILRSLSSSVRMYLVTLDQRRGVQIECRRKRTRAGYPFSIERVLLRTLIKLKGCTLTYLLPRYVVSALHLGIEAI